MAVASPIMQKVGGRERPPTCWVADGTRTRDIQDHNLVLYQLNYSHHCRPEAARVDLSRSGGPRPNQAGPPSPRVGPNSAATAAMSLVEGPGGVTKAVLR